MVDESGRRGSVERTFTARINGFGQLHVTDLADRRQQRCAARRACRRRSPRISPATSSAAYVELFSEVPEQLQNATVVMEVAQDETSRALDSTPARFQQVQAGADRRRVAEAGVPIALLPAGEYVARAVDLGQRPQGGPGRQAVPRHPRGGDGVGARQRDRADESRRRRSPSRRASTRSTSRRC